LKYSNSSEEENEMNRYISEKMVKISRYRNFFPTLGKDIQNDIYARMNELLEEEKKYCDKDNYKHISQMEYIHHMFPTRANLRKL